MVTWSRVTGPPWSKTRPLWFGSTWFHHLAQWPLFTAVINYYDLLVHKQWLVPLSPRGGGVGGVVLKRLAARPSLVSIQRSDGSLRASPSRPSPLKGAGERGPYCGSTAWYYIMFIEGGGACGACVRQDDFDLDYLLTPGSVTSEGHNSS